MAFPQWRRGSRRVYVYYSDPNTHRLRQLPRPQTKHLDGQPPEQVHAWVEEWTAKNGVAHDRSQRLHVAPGDKIATLWRHYQQQQQSDRQRRPERVKQETQLFERDILPFFVRECGVKDPTLWHKFVPGFHLHLMERGLADRTIQKILWTLERFGKYLVFAQAMTFPFAVRIPAREFQRETPLKNPVTPGDVMEFARAARLDYQDLDFPLMAMLGFFAALRPSELIALERADLVTGEEAERQSKSYEGMKTLGLATRLGVGITRTIGNSGPPVPMTKSLYSRATVTIFDSDAARWIADRVKRREEGRLFPFSYPWAMTAWSRYAMPKLGVTLHDLRRSAGLYLGSTKFVPPLLLKDWMRHSNIQTTMLYCRTPERREPKRQKRQDFDDVV
jgi:integrase